MLNSLRQMKNAKAAANRLYATVAAQARNPAFFVELSVPDTMDGRFDLICLHAWLVLDGLGSRRAVAQEFVNAVFIGFDEALRQSGTGDIGMNRRLKALAGAFYGRLEAYRAAGTAEELAEAIRRNVFRGGGDKHAQARTMAIYALQSRSRLAEIDVNDGKLAFPPLMPM